MAGSSGPSLRIDFARAAADYGRHRAGFPESFFARLRARGVGAPDQRALDLGTGTGTVARGLAQGGARVVGLDPGAALLRQADALARALPASARIAWVQARAERAPFAAGAFDVVTAGQCWHWFDRPRAAAEARRLLAPGGWLVIAHYDWLSLPGSLAAATEALIRAHNPGWQASDGTGLYPAWTVDLAVAGFEALETFSFDEPARYDHVGWRGRIRASAGVAASLAPDAVARFDAELGDLLARAFPQEPLDVPHRVWAVVGRAPGGEQRP